MRPRIRQAKSPAEDVQDGNRHPVARQRAALGAREGCARLHRARAHAAPRPAGPVAVARSGRSAARNAASSSTSPSPAMPPAIRAGHAVAMSCAATPTAPAAVPRSPVLWTVKRCELIVQFYKNCTPVREYVLRAAAAPIPRRLGGGRAPTEAKKGLQPDSDLLQAGERHRRQPQGARWQHIAPYWPGSAAAVPAAMERRIIIYTSPE